jgi:queuine tRNA-ribosyltransferase
MNKLKLRDNIIKLPIYSPDATRAVVRGLDYKDLEKIGIESLVTNTYHLLNFPGSSVISAIGGLQNFMQWNNLLITDSGGFQLLSMVHKDASFGKINDQGVIFKKGKRKYKFTPEKSIRVQFDLNSDIMFCLDDCPSIKASKLENEKTVERTIKWAARCKEEYIKQLNKRKIEQKSRPLLFAIIQGGDDKFLRTKCAKHLLDIGFDGYGFGGWPIDKNNDLKKSILSFTASLMPGDLPKFALGVGNPQALVDAYNMGYNMFDCVLPTRDARHKRLYVLNCNFRLTNLKQLNPVYEYLYIEKERYVRDFRPISEYCDCFTCVNYSRAYLHHLFTIKDSLAGRLATIHNLRTYVLLINNLRKYG